MRANRRAYGQLPAVPPALVRRDVPMHVCGLWVYDHCFYWIAIAALTTAVVALSLLVGWREDTSSTAPPPVDAACSVHFSQYRFPQLLTADQLEQMLVLFNGDQCRSISNRGYATLLGVVHAIFFTTNLTREVDAYIFPEYDPNVTSYTCTNHSLSAASACEGDGASAPPNATADCVLAAVVAGIGGQKMELCYRSLDAMLHYIEREFLVSFAYGCRGTFHIMYDSFDTEARCITYSYRAMRLPEYELVVVPVGKAADAPARGAAGRRLSTWTKSYEVGIRGFMQGLKDYDWARKTYGTLMSVWTAAQDEGAAQKPAVPPPHLVSERSVSVAQTIDGIAFDASLEFEMFWWYRAVTVDGVTEENNLTYVRLEGNLSVQATSPGLSAQLPMWDALTLNLNDVLYLGSVHAKVGLTLAVQLHAGAGVRFAVQANSFTSSLLSADSKYPVMGAALTGNASATADVRVTLAVPVIVSAYLEKGPAIHFLEDSFAGVPIVNVVLGLVNDLTHLCYGVALVPYVQLELAQVAAAGASVRWGGPSDPKPALSTRECAGAQTKVCAQAGVRLWELQQWQYEFLFWGGDVGKGSLTRLLADVFWPTTCYDLAASADACTTDTRIAAPDFEAWARTDLCPPRKPKVDAAWVLGALTTIASLAGARIPE